MTGQIFGRNKDGYLTGHARARLTGDENLTGHIAYRIFDRLQVKYRVPYLYRAVRHLLS